MKKKYIWIALGVITLAVVAFMCEPPIAEATNTLTFQGLPADQVSIVNANMKVLPDGAEVAMVVIRDSVIQYYGIKRENGILEKMDNSEAVYEIGSISKVFTATMLASYVHSGDVQLDDMITDRLGYKFNKGIEVSYQDLANHTSGLPRMPSNIGAMAGMSSNPYKDYDDALLDEYCQERMVQLTSEKKVRYSNLGAGLLGHTLRKIDNLTYEQMLQNVIVQKYGLKNTTTVRANVQDRLVHGRNDRGREVSSWDFQSLVGCGGVKSTVADLAQFVLAQFDAEDEILAMTRCSTFKESERSEVGLGWFMINKEDSDGQVFWHNGMTGGYSSMLAMDYENHNAVIALSNIAYAGGQLEPMAFGLLKSMQGK